MVTATNGDLDIRQIRASAEKSRAIAHARNQDLARHRVAEGWAPLAGAEVFNQFKTEEKVSTLWLNRSDTLIQTVKNMSYDTGSSGGFTVPGDSTIDEMYEVGLVQGDTLRRVCNVVGEGMENNTSIPVAIDNGAMGRLIGPGSSSQETDPSFARRNSTPFKFTSDEVIAPYELWRDAGPKFFASVSRMLGYRISRIQAKSFSSGTGVGSPHGWTGLVDLGVTTASATAIAIDELFQLVFSVDAAYWNDPTRQPCFMMAQSTFKNLSELKDGIGDYLLKKCGILDFGPIVINNWVPTMAPGARAVWFGDFKAAITIHDIDARIVRYNETLVESDMLAVQAFHSADCITVDKQAVKTLQLAAS